MLSLLIFFLEIISSYVELSPVEIALSIGVDQVCLGLLVDLSVFSTILSDFLMFLVNSTHLRVSFRHVTSKSSTHSELLLTHIASIVILTFIADVLLESLVQEVLEVRSDSPSLLHRLSQTLHELSSSMIIGSKHRRLGDIHIGILIEFSCALDDLIHFSKGINPFIGVIPHACECSCVSGYR